MAFVNITDEIPQLPAEVEEIWRNDSFSLANMENKQILRKYRTGYWVLDLRVNFFSIYITLQEQQAQQIIAGGASTRLCYLDCVVVKEE